MNRFFAKHKAAAAITCLVIIALFLLVIVFSDYEKNSRTEPVAYDDGVSVIYYNDKQYKMKDLDSYLLIGLDKFDEDTQTNSYNNSQQSDFLLLLCFDKSSKSGFIIHINRDTMAEINVLGVNGELTGTTTAQLALSHTYGSGGKESCRNTRNAVEKLLHNIDIDHYVSFTMDAVEVFTNKLKGVDVFVEDDFSNIDPTITKGSTVNLMGEHALNFIRARGGMTDSSNLARMNRQRVFINSCKEKMTDLKQKGSLDSKGIFTSVSDYLVSDCSIENLASMADCFISYDIGEIIVPEGEASVVNDHIQFAVDEEKLQKLVIDLFYEEVLEK